VGLSCASEEKGSPPSTTKITTHHIEAAKEFIVVKSENVHIIYCEHLFIDRQI